VIQGEGAVIGTPASARKTCSRQKPARIGPATSAARTARREAAADSAAAAPFIATARG